MGDLVKPAKAKQVLRTQEFNAEQAVGDETVGQPARLGKRRQQQRIGPKHESKRESRQRAVARATFPEQAADHHRRKLRDSGKGNQPDRDQRIGFARHPKIQVAKAEDHGDGPASDFQQQAGEIGACRQP